MKLRLYHHPDGTRVAYRETGTGQPLALLHSALLSHREWEPAVEQLASRFRVVLPDLPLHGDSEDDPRHPYTLDWFADVLGGFAADVLGPRPALGGHGMGAEIVLHALARGTVRPSRLVLLSNRLHAPQQRSPALSAARVLLMAGSVPTLDRALGYGARAMLKPDRVAERLSVRADPAVRDLLRHAIADVPGNANLARSWSKCARRWPRGARAELLALYPRLRLPVLLLWADQDPLDPIGPAEEALRLLPHGQLRLLSSTGFLMAYDDPIGVARELLAFCG
ncbi:MAG TPA: alpha/beta hydrolase [Solirubrobacteraceae bacterium]|nr:alpha/beta hydrolase [Solirubrobacteraceae bacterium]